MRNASAARMRDDGYRRQAHFSQSMSRGSASVRDRNTTFAAFARLLFATQHQPRIRALRLRPTNQGHYDFRHSLLGESYGRQGLGAYMAPLRPTKPFRKSATSYILIISGSIVSRYCPPLRMRDVRPPSTGYGSRPLRSLP